MTTTVQHNPVMLQETLEALNILPSGIYIDATYGRGGHSQEILQRLNDKGKLICCDKDPQAISHGRQRFANDARISFIQTCFGELSQVAYQCGIHHKVNGILLDLGVSSPQLEEAQRGFSFMREGPLDMRMDPTQGISAYEWINNASMLDIAYVLKKFGEETFAKRIANNIIENRAKKPIQTTLELANLVSGCVPAKKIGRHPATKTFQAIRIHINQELRAIDQVLKGAFDILAPQGRLVIISFHSLEDRKVKQFFRSQSKVTLPAGVSIPEKDLKTPFSWVIKRQRPLASEIANNLRARSAILRVAQKNAF